MNLNTKIEALNRVGKTTASRFKKLGLNTVEDLIFYFPFRYEDYSLVKKINELKAEEVVSIKGKIQLIANRRSYRAKKNITEALVADDTGTIKIVWFNQPFLIKNLKQGDEIILSGKVDISGIQMISPEYEKVRQEMIHTAKIVPVYHLTQNITQKQIRFLLSQTKSVINQISDYLPDYIKQKYDFLDLNLALQELHFPTNLDLTKKANLRLKFDELFLIQLAIQKQKKDLQSNKAFKLAFLEKQTKDFVDSLSFELTGAQKKSAWEIIRNLELDKPMNRLLQGDVGSGKTIVVALAILNTILNGYKVILMAPTEILANQHYQNFLKLLNKYNFNIALLTGHHKLLNNQKIKKSELYKQMDSGAVDLIIGTHAVIQETVKIKDLGLVIVDEQHRFGVKQRKALLARDKAQKLTPHFLSMTATPIPRSFLLTLYGDLDVSIIDEMPKGRQIIKTKVVYENQRQSSYDFIKNEIKQGRQAFVICPLIDPSDKFGAKSVTEEYDKLSKIIFPNLKIGLMHGRLKSTEKDMVMQKFLDKEFDILVSTSVIEVGIDVPNATIIMIESADKFGLAQLHQFRGRVGRGEHQSYCLLFSDSNATKTKQRLNFMETCSDGFVLAEKDLELRGSGEVYGTKQSGLPDLKIASLADTKLISLCQKLAQELVEQDKLSAELLEKIKDIEVIMHFE